LHRLTSTFVLGYHGCDRKVGERLLKGEAFKPSNNEYDWLGSGIYFWESNPHRGLHFAGETSKRPGSTIADPFVIGAVIELGLCLDLTTLAGIAWIRRAHDSLAKLAQAARADLPVNMHDNLRRNLDCAVMNRLHGLFDGAGLPAVDTVKGIFTEGKPVYPTAGFSEKTHIQIAVRNPACIKGVFRVPQNQLDANLES